MRCCHRRQSAAAWSGRTSKPIGLRRFTNKAPEQSVVARTLLMRIARRTFLTSSIGTAVAPAVLRLAHADTPPITFKLHHAFSAVSGVHDKFLLPWARKIETESGGRLHVDIFPSMQLGGAPATLFDQARDGSADIVWTSPTLTPGR